MIDYMLMKKPRQSLSIKLSNDDGPEWLLIFRENWQPQLTEDAQNSEHLFNVPISQLLTKYCRISVI